MQMDNPNGNVYRVKSGKEFVILFSPPARDREEFLEGREELKSRFLRNYTPEHGFSIYYDGAKNRYVIFTEADRFQAEVSDTIDRLCLYVKRVYQITQSDTLNENVQSVRIIGLPVNCLCLGGNKKRFDVAGETQPANASDGTGLREMLHYVHDNSVVLPDRDPDKEGEIAEQLERLDDQRRIIEEKKKFEEQPGNLFTVSYIRFDPIRQDITDGVLYKFQISDPDKFDEKKAVEGKGVNISINDEGYQVKGTISSYKEPYLIIKFNSHDDFFSRIAKAGTIQESPNPEYKYKLEAIKRLQNATSPSIHLLDIIFSHKLLPMHEKISYMPPSESHIKMNSMQITAVRRALNTDDFLLVQGPPGTGKTTIITEMIRNFVLEGKRVLICSKNNLAVDNVIEGCMDLYYDDRKKKKMQCVRLGNQEKVLKSVHPVLPMQLTMALQNDVKLESDRQRKRFQNAAVDRIQILSAAKHDIRDLCTMMQKVYGEYGLTRKMEERSHGAVGVLLIGPKMGTKIRDLLKELNSEISSILETAYQLANTRTIFSGTSITANQVADRRIELENRKDQLLQHYNNFLGLSSSLLECLEHSQRRSRIVFGKTAGELTGELGADLEAEDQIRNSVRDYKGNAAAGALKVLKQPFDIQKDVGSELKEEISTEFDELNARLSSLNKILKEWDRELEDPKLSLQEDLIHSLKIVGATCIGIKTNDYFKKSEFDVAVVDEAGQITMHDLLVPLEKARKIILIGDHMQLPPMNENDFCEYVKENHLLGYGRSEMSEEGSEEYESSLHMLFEKSLFEELYRAGDINPVNKVMLDTQFRMHPVIAEFISEQFYNNGYHSAEGMAEKRTLRIGRFRKPMYFIDTSEAPGHNETAIKDAEGNNAGYYNQCEAEIVGRITAELVHFIRLNQYEMPREKPEDNPLMTSGKTFDIGIITAYKAQKSQIRKAIEKAMTELSVDGEKPYTGEEARDIAANLSVDTLDSFQGRDNQIILYSFVRSNKRHSIGFLTEVRRLNVMMTRAKSLLIMVGDSDTLTKNNAPCVHEPEKKASEYYGALIDYIKNNRNTVLSHYRD